jgi:hypothetical protein
MSGFIQEHVRIARPLGWIDQFERLLARELAPSPRKFRTAVRIATIATVAVALTATCHVNGEFGVYFVWLLAGAGPMMSARRALSFLIAEAIALSASVVMALTLVETPWLLLPFLFLAFTVSTYFGTIWKLGVSLVLIEVVCLNTFYGAIFASDIIGWNRIIRQLRYRLRRARALRQLAVARSQRENPNGVAGEQHRTWPRSSA